MKIAVLRDTAACWISGHLRTSSTECNTQNPFSQLIDGTHKHTNARALTAILIWIDGIHFVLWDPIDE